MPFNGYDKILLTIFQNLLYIAVMVIPTIIYILKMPKIKQMNKTTLAITTMISLLSISYLFITVQFLDIKGENLELYDFMTGKVVYNNICNGYNEFSELEDDSLDNLQMYKYELKKDENNKYYLAGFNPVDK